jgi:hypothetical protein
MYYVVHKQENLIRVAIHLGMHDHPMVEGRSWETLYQVKSLVKEEMFHTSKAIVSAIALVTSKTFLFKHLLNKDEEGLVEVFKGNKLCLVMDKFITLPSPNI